MATCHDCGVPHVTHPDDIPETMLSYGKTCSLSCVLLSAWFIGSAAQLVQQRFRVCPIYDGSLPGKMASNHLSPYRHLVSSDFCFVLPAINNSSGLLTAHCHDSSARDKAKICLHLPGRRTGITGHPWISVHGIIAEMRSIGSGCTSTFCDRIDMHTPGLSHLIVTVFGNFCNVTCPKQMHYLP